MPIQLQNEMPHLAEILGRAAEQRPTQWITEYIEERLPWFRLLEKDVATLVGRGLSVQKLTTCYRNSLLNRPEIQKVIFEVHGAAFLAEGASELDLHVPRGDGSGRNFDVFARIAGMAINGDAKTRKDEFPFNLPEIRGDEAGIYGGSRATLDPHDAAVLGSTVADAHYDPYHNPTPESTVVRQILASALAQLPTGGCNLVMFGQIEGCHDNLFDALYGTEFVGFGRDSKTNEPFHRWARMQNGAFTTPDSRAIFESLSGVLWYRLVSDGESVRGSYRGHRNPYARVPIPNEVTQVLDAVMESRTAESR